jgi:hypothetical protein
MGKPTKKSENTSEATVQLALIDFDAIDNVEPEDEQPAEQSAPEVQVETEETVLKTVESFDDDSQFGKDPLKGKYLEFGTEAKALTDPADATPRFVHLGILCANIMVAERNIAPNAYERSKVIKKCENALRLCNVPESLVRPNEILGAYWLTKLVRSTPGGEGETRTFDAADMPPADWFGGNISFAVLRILAKCASNTSKKEELDIYEFKDGYEAHVRGWVDQLRNGNLASRQVITLIEFRAKLLKRQAEDIKYAGMSEADRAKIKESEAAASLHTKLTELGSKAMELSKMASEECKKGKEELRDFLINTQVIPPMNLTPEELASRMTKADAKALVQALIKLYPSRPDRLEVFKTLYNTTKTIVAQMKSAHSQPSEPAAKAG